VKMGVGAVTFISLLVVCLVQHSGTVPVHASSSHLNVAAWNIEILGVSKMGKPEVVEKLVEIILRYDLVMIQEVRDISGEAIVNLLDAVNRASKDPFEMELSIRLGRTSSKEQYAYFYRTNKLAVVDTFQYPEILDQFERPPFSVRFKTIGSYDVKEFGFIGVHAKPGDAPKEIDHLVDVYDMVRAKWQLDDFIIGGDLNADCKYVSKSKWKDIRLRTQSRFRWLIEDGIDTTVYHSGCTLDRLIIAGEGMFYSYLSDTAVAYRFDDEMNLTYDEAKAVSDHVPVEMVLR